METEFDYLKYWIVNDIEESQDVSPTHKFEFFLDRVIFSALLAKITAESFKNVMGTTTVFYEKLKVLEKDGKLWEKELP